jgi:hypothetical protein
MLSVVYFIVILSVNMQSVNRLSVVILSVIMLSVIILNVITLSIVILSVVILSFIMLRVVAPSTVDLLVPTNLHQLIIYLRFNKKVSFMRRSIVLSFPVQLEVPAFGKADGQNWSRKLYKT